jgi:hypothetical protein
MIDVNFDFQAEVAARFNRTLKNDVMFWLFDAGDGKFFAV